MTTREPDPVWSTVDQYIETQLAPADPALAWVLEASEAAGLPPIQVAPNQGKLLALWARSIGARRVLELGTLAGYSTIWLARALPPGGSVVTLELDPKHAEVAQASFARAGLVDRIELRLGRALDSLQQLAQEQREPFDFVFIDADKASIPDYFHRTLELTRPGGIIVVDNVVRRGALADPNSRDPAVIGVRRFHELLASEPRVSATTVQTVGSKGYDGFTYALVGG
jgi:predicted O-methyltransferase YrrM